MQPAPDERRPCRPALSAERGQARVAIRLALPPSVDEEEAEAVVASAAATLALSGVTLSLRRPALDRPEGPPLVSAKAPATTAPDALRDFARASLRPVVELAERSPPDSPIVVALVERLFSNRAKVGRFVRGDIDGLTVGHRGTAPDAPLEEALGLGPHAPIVLVEMGARAGDTLAHELGHALGLDHVEDPDNLMHAGKRPQCRRVLDGAQRTAIDEALSAPPQ